MPRGMMARLALVLVVALTIEFAGNAVLNRLQEREIISDAKFRSVAEQLANAAQVAGGLDPARRPQVMADMVIDGVRLNWVPRTVIADASGASPQLARVRARMKDSATGLAAREMRLSLIPSADGRRDLLGALALDDGSFVTFRIHPFLDSSPSFALIAFLHLLLVGGVLGIALLMIRTLVRPLDDLAAAADATGKGARGEFPADGPVEVRRVAAAFRAMQARLLAAMDDHTNALVAVSHDLRTPIQRMRLRTASLPDTEMRDALSADLVDMERFIASVGAFIRSGEEETARLVDLAAVAMTMVDNAADAGFDVSYEGPDDLPLTLKPLALKRALANLVDNACRHGTRVRVVLTPGPPVTIRVEDDGPGIPSQRREEALLPFQQLDRPRSRHQGSGLGLAIVKRAAAAMNAQVELGDSAMGGLMATIRLPFPAVRVEEA